MNEARDLQRWASRRSAGRAGVPPSREERKARDWKRRDWAAMRWI
jgi:hypothetical protein